MNAAPFAEQTRYRYPVAFCPCCRRPVIYSGDPRDRRSISVRAADDGYDGCTVLCAKCKTMLVITESARPASPLPQPRAVCAR